MKKIALINPASPFLMVDGDRPCLGLAYLATEVRKDNEVQIFDFAVENQETLLKELINYEPAIIGFTATTPVFYQAVTLLQKIKNMATFKFISVIGGVHASVLPKSCLEYFDYVFMGEGEKTFSAFCNGHSYVEGNFVHSCSVDIDGLMPARDLLPMEKYNMQLDGERCTTIITSRGCPYNCIFCSSILGKKVRLNSAENVVREIKDIITNDNITNFYFLDDVFTWSKKRVLDICDWIKADGLDIKFRATTRINLVDERVLGALAGAGCKMVCYGLESGSNRVLKAYNKGFTVEDIRRVVKATKQAGIGIKAFWLKSELETEDEKKATLDLIDELQLQQNDLYNLTAYPGSKIWKEKHGDNEYFTAEFFKNCYHGGK